MKNIIRGVFVALAMVLGVGLTAPAQAADFASPAEAQAMLDKAVAYVKANGVEKAAAAFMDPKGGFRDRDLYVSMSRMSDGVRLAHVNPKAVGKSLYGSTDVDGKPYGDEMMELASTKGKGVVNYRFPNPVTKQPMDKVSYVEKVGDVVLLVGAYK
ncbi:cache domain-containing protein [Oleispirillum naphthae]|uniref:cache domain-containing protein n=1 Tax=Oleispirillum naphthae TaxID=2838853 RepID=UPI0030822A5B